MSGTYRHGRHYCQVVGCRSHAMQAVGIDLPTSWSAELGYTALPLNVGLCRRHGREVTRLVTALLEARCEYAHQLAIIGRAVDADERGRVERLDQALTEAEGALAYQRERAERAERALRIAEAELGRHRCPGRSEHPSLQDVVSEARATAGVDVLPWEDGPGAAAAREEFASRAVAVDRPGGEAA